MIIKCMDYSFLNSIEINEIGHAPRDLIFLIYNFLLTVQICPSHATRCGLSPIPTNSIRHQKEFKETLQF